MNIFLIQDGYEDKLADINKINIDEKFYLSRKRNDKKFYIYFFVLFFIRLLKYKLFNEKAKVYYSTNEKCEYLLMLGLLSCFFTSTLDFVRLKVNERESSFRDNLSANIDSPLRIRIFNYLFPNLICWMINDVGQSTWVVKIGHSCVSFINEKNDEYSIEGVNRIIVLAEPLRSKAIFDVDSLNNKVIRALDYVKNVVSEDELDVLVKEHPSQECIQLSGFRYSFINKKDNVFDTIVETDLVIGTFGSVIDVCPAICPTISLLELDKLQDKFIVERVINSGAILFEYCDNSKK